MLRFTDGVVEMANNYVHCWLYVYGRIWIQDVQEVSELVRKHIPVPNDSIPTFL